MSQSTAARPALPSPTPANPFPFVGGPAVNSSIAASSLSLSGPLLALYIAAPFYKGAVTPIIGFDPTALLGVMNAALGMLTAFRIIFGREKVGPSIRSTLTLWFALSALVLVGAVYSPNPRLAGEAALTFVLLGLLPLTNVLGVATNRVAIRRFLWTFAWLGVLLTVTGILAVDTLAPSQRLSTFDTNPILLASGAMCLPLVGWTFLWRAAAWTRLPMLLLTPVSISVAASAARGPLIAAGIALGGLMIFRGRHRLLKLPLVVVAVFVVGTFLPVYLPDIAASRLDSLASSIPFFANDEDRARDYNVDIRLTAYDFAVDMFKRSPLIGNGTRSFEIEADNHWELWVAAYPHNLPLQFAAEYGGFGLLLLGALFVRPVRNWFQPATDPLWTGVIALHIAFALQALFSFGLDNRPLWALTLLASVAPSAVHREARQVVPVENGPSVQLEASAAGGGTDLGSTEGKRGGIHAAKHRRTATHPLR